jgi:hypothetical protein
MSQAQARGTALRGIALSLPIDGRLFRVDWHSTQALRTLNVQYVAPHSFRRFY